MVIIMLMTYRHNGYHYVGVLKIIMSRFLARFC